VDSATDQVARFRFKSGDCEPQTPSVSEFISALFNPDPVQRREWAEAVDQIRRA
jgi:hypothetical protein